MSKRGTRDRGGDGTGMGMGMGMGMKRDGCECEWDDRAFWGPLGEIPTYLFAAAVGVWAWGFG